MIKFFRKTILLFSIFFFTTSLSAEEPVKGTIAIFSKKSRSIEITAMASKTLYSVHGTISSLGRFIPIEYNRFNNAVEKQSDLDLTESFYKKTAQYLNAKIYLVISIKRAGENIYGTMKIIPLDPEYSSLAKIIRIKSKIPLNVPLKFSREVALLHKRIPLKCTVLSRHDKTLRINAGQWHGIKKQKYQTKGGVIFKVIKPERYRSYIEKISDEPLNDKFTLDIYPEYKKVLKDLNSQIEENIQFKYGLQNTLLKGGNPEKRFAESCLMINPGSNACLPGYGSYLATEYMGFKNPSHESTGTIISFSTLFLQLNFTEFLTGYKSNFFPWIKDSDKSTHMQNLQIFLWSSTFFTVTSAFLNQLAYNYEKGRKLPPFFEYKDSFAVALSLFSPGGGLFYKGYRYLGWGYFFSEMTILSLGFYNLELNSSYKYYFAAFGVMKFLEIVNAYFINTSYPFYRTETSSADSELNFFIGLKEVKTEEVIYQASLIYRF